MHDIALFIGIMLAAVFAYLWFRLGNPLKWGAYFKTPDGLGVLRGIVLAPAAAVVLALLLLLLPDKAKAGDWLNDASVYAGIDVTKKLSPMCDAGPIDDHGTSNLGARLNVWRSESRKVRVNGKYTHHSCAVGSDDRQYDAVGIEVEFVHKFRP